MRRSKSKPSVGSRIVQRMQAFTEALERGEEISERFTCRKVSLDLQPARYTPAEVRKTRELLKASQAVFAQFLGMSVKTVRSGNRGKSPVRWRARLWTRSGAIRTASSNDFAKLSLPGKHG